jgi:hypothetical protein
MEVERGIFRDGTTSVILVTEKELKAKLRELTRERKMVATEIELRVKSLGEYLTKLDNTISALKKYGPMELKNG